MPNAKGVPLPRTGAMYTKRPPAYHTRDMHWVYEFIRRLSTPFNQWPAFKAGIIDAQGNIKKQVNDLSPREQQTWSHLDQLSVGIKRLIMKVPGIQPKLKTIVGTMMLMKERKDSMIMLSSEPTELILEREFYRILNTLQESEGAVNAASAGNVAGITGEPPVGLRKTRNRPLLFKMIKRRKPEVK